MRPMFAGQDNMTGSYDPRPLLPGKAVDTALRENATQQMLTPSNNGVGNSPAFGSFVDINAGKYPTASFLGTAPIAALPMRPRNDKQGQTMVGLNLVDPGAQTILPIVQTPISQLINRQPGANGT